MKVLVVDDNSQSRRFANYMLNQLGCEVHTADSGESSLNILATETFDMIFLDWNMPGLNGNQTLKAYNDLAKLKKSTLNVAIYTSHSFAEIEIPAAKKINIGIFISKRLSPFEQFNSFKKCIKNFSGIKNLRRSYS